MKRAVLAVWEFIVGDDWLTAAGVIIAVGAAALLASAGVTAWWVIPVAVVVLLARSIAGSRPQ